MLWRISESGQATQIIREEEKEAQATRALLWSIAGALGLVREDWKREKSNKELQAGFVLYSNSGGLAAGSFDHPIRRRVSTSKSLRLKDHGPDRLAFGTRHFACPLTGLPA